MLAKVFPFLAWFKNYDKASLQLDALSGLTVALVLIPQSMAYAQLAGLPAYYGLYASFLPPMIAALFGSSRQLATGPVAVVSLMTAASLAPLATAGSPGYIAYAILLALMVLVVFGNTRPIIIATIALLFMFLLIFENIDYLGGTAGVRAAAAAADPARKLRRFNIAVSPILNSLSQARQRRQHGDQKGNQPLFSP